jgi:Ca2+/Na+ antiporter
VEGALDYDNLRLVPELKDSGMGMYADITGLLIQGWSIAEYRHHYATNFGLGGAEDDYSQVVFDVAYGASAWSSFWRLLLPLSVVMAMVLLVSKLRNDLQDVRSTLPVTILLTLVFLQQSYRSALPDLPYLSFLDQVYVVAYMLTLIAFVLVIWIGRRYSELESAAGLMEEQQATAQLQRLGRIDDVWPVLVVLLGSASIAICWLLIPAG